MTVADAVDDIGGVWRFANLCVLRYVRPVVPHFCVLHCVLHCVPYCLLHGVLHGGVFTAHKHADGASAAMLSLGLADDIDAWDAVNVPGLSAFLSASAALTKRKHVVALTPAAASNGVAHDAASMVVVTEAESSNVKRNSKKRSRPSSPVLVESVSGVDGLPPAMPRLHSRMLSGASLSDGMATPFGDGGSVGTGSGRATVARATTRLMR